MLVALTTDTHYGFNGVSEGHHLKMLKRLKEQMDKRGCRVLLHTGDWATFRQRQLKKTLTMFREILTPQTAILCVLGNHDFWCSTLDDEHYTLDQLFALHHEWFKELDIRYLQEDKLVVVEDVAVVGYDGWYANPNIHSLTNDSKWLPQLGTVEAADVHGYMAARSIESFERLLSLEVSTYRKVVGLTHMPLMPGDYNGNPSWLEFMADKCDIICFGHSHKKIAAMPFKKSLIYNAGSDYGNIKFDFIEV